MDVEVDEWLNASGAAATRRGVSAREREEAHNVSVLAALGLCEPAMTKRPPGKAGKAAASSGEASSGFHSTGDSPEEGEGAASPPDDARPSASAAQPTGGAASPPGGGASSSMTELERYKQKLLMSYVEKPVGGESGKDDDDSALGRILGSASDVIGAEATADADPAAATAASSNGAEASGASAAVAAAPAPSANAQPATLASSAASATGGSASTAAAPTVRARARSQCRPARDFWALLSLPSSARAIGSQAAAAALHRASLQVAAALGGSTPRACSLALRLARSSHAACTLARTLPRAIRARAYPYLTSCWPAYACSPRSCSHASVASRVHRLTSSRRLRAATRRRCTTDSSSTFPTLASLGAHPSQSSARSRHAHATRLPSLLPLCSPLQIPRAALHPSAAASRPQPPALRRRRLAAAAPSSHLLLTRISPPLTLLSGTPASTQPAECTHRTMRR